MFTSNTSTRSLITQWALTLELLLIAMLWTPAANYQIVIDFAVSLAAALIIQQALPERRKLWISGLIGVAVLFSPVVLMPAILVFGGSENLLVAVVPVCFATLATYAVLKSQPLLSVIAVPKDEFSNIQAGSVFSTPR
jgi:peptidoglycan/LPS O-acetylase OafA/YrhL